MSSTNTRIEQNKQLASRVTAEMVDGRNFDAIDEVFTEDFVQHGGVDGDIRGSAAFQAWFEQVYAGFSDFAATEEFSLAEDDLVASLVTYSGTHDGAFMGIPATGAHVEITGITIFRVEDGTIPETWVEVDTVGMLQQLGAMDAPAA